MYIVVFVMYVVGSVKVFHVCVLYIADIIEYSAIILENISNIL
jgi:hypothetical protein